MEETQNRSGNSEPTDFENDVFILRMASQMNPSATTANARETPIATHALAGHTPAFKLLHCTNFDIGRVVDRARR